MDEKLKFIFTNVNDWLKFAEAKNGVLIAFNNALVFGLFSILDSTSKPLNDLTTQIYITCLLLLIASAISILSFIPQLREPILSLWNIPKAEPDKDNTLYFGDILKYEKEDYLELIYKENDADTQSINKYQLQLASQIIINSKIAYFKYELFVFSSWITFIAIIISILSAIFIHP